LPRRCQVRALHVRKTAYLGEDVRNDVSSRDLPDEAGEQVPIRRRIGLGSLETGDPVALDGADNEQHE